MTAAGSITAGFMPDCPPSSMALAAPATNATQATISTVATKKTMTSHRVTRRALSCLSKKFTAARARLRGHRRDRLSRTSQVNDTFGAARISGFSISSICASAKPNVPAIRLLGNICTLLL